MTLLDIIEIYNMKSGRRIDDIGSLYEDIDIDARIDKEILVGSLLDECGAMNCLYDTTATFKYFSNNFFKKYKWNISKLLDTLELKYDPLTNKNVKWTETTKIEQDLDTAESQSENRGRSTSEEDSERNTGSVKNRYSDNEENKISAMIPQLMAASAKLNIGLKKMKWLPPMNGIHCGQSNSKSGK